MNDEHRVCAVVVKPAGSKHRYAVLRRVKNWDGWELPKGHLEGDDAEQSIRQELKEECGITDIESVEPLDYELEWEYERDGDQHHTTCKCFLVTVPKGTMIDTAQNPHEEHDGGHFLNYRDARDILHHDNQRELLEHVHERLQED